MQYYVVTRSFGSDGRLIGKGLVPCADRRDAQELAQAMSAVPGPERREHWVCVQTHTVLGKVMLPIADLEYLAKAARQPTDAVACAGTQEET